MTPLQYYMDNHVHAGIIAGLKLRNVDCLTAVQDGAAELDDPAVLQRATELNRVLFTMDKDFLVITSQWLRSGKPFAGVVYAHQLEITIGQAIRDLELVAKGTDANEMRNRVLRLPL